MTDVVLVNPVMRNCFPVGLGQLAAYLEAHGVDVAVVDASPEGLSAQATADRVLALAPRLVGLTGLWVHYPFLRAVSRTLERENAGIVQIAGGFWCAGTTDVVLDDTAVAFVVHGEGEVAGLALARAILDGRDPTGAPGVSFLRDGAVHTTARPPLIGDLDALPLPAYDKFDMDFYIRRWPADAFRAQSRLGREALTRRLGGRRTVREATLFTSRGCFGRCTFCSAPAFGIRYRPYGEAYVIAHARLLQERYGADAFEITESLTFVHRRQVKRFCRAVIAARLDTLLLCVLRGDIELDDEAVDLMRRAGVYKVRIGYESANPYILNRIIGKRISVDNYRAVTARLTRAGIAIEGTFILNMPGETARSMHDTYAFVRDTGLGFGHVFFANPLPGTGLFEWAETHGFIPDRRRLIAENPGKDKGRSDFATYIRHFDFNRLPPRRLTGYRDLIEGAIAVNRARRQGRRLRWRLAALAVHRLRLPLRRPGFRERFPVLYDYLVLSRGRLGRTLLRGLWREAVRRR